MNGEDVDPHNCLFINPAIPKLQDVLAQLAQPEWDDSSGKLRIKKQPHEAGEQEPDSPDAYDAAISWRFARMRGGAWCREIDVFCEREGVVRRSHREDEMNDPR